MLPNTRTCLMLNVGEVHWFIHPLICFKWNVSRAKESFHDRKGELKAKKVMVTYRIYSVSTRYVLVTIVHFLCDIPTEATFSVCRDITRHLSYTRWCMSIFKHYKHIDTDNFMWTCQTKNMGNTFLTNSNCSPFWVGIIYTM